MTDNLRGRPGQRLSNWLWLVVLSAVAAALYASAFVKMPNLGF